MVIQQTFVLIKPDGVARGLIGEIIKRFEQRGFKIVALKLVQVNKDFAKMHYTEEIEKRRGKQVREALLDYVTSGPVVAMVVEGVDAIENVRKLVGSTESKSSLPGTIRGDYSHVSFDYADQNHLPVRNVVHASSDKTDAIYEISLWFSIEEFFSYRLSSEEYLYN